ncbi:hypothetical protein [Pseudomonas weihenstephanensis]|uniref:hypothetical protein n=1 Tax=Pseudomonas weihenstephanensis TaxID=1608994 RepID=UPI00193B40AE|nr:hypothetical protein [Pseudomonas weihenstephanensis]MBM1189342.1 hypothetical protein [Pseudomonas weihenstephanensis]
MNPSTIENYYFHRMYSIDLDTALHTLQTLKRYKRLDVRYALLRDLTVSYARPFSVNKGKLAKHTLGVKKYVPKEMVPLHEELVRLRMQQFAHTDLNYYNPKASSLGAGPLGMMFRGFDYAALLAKLPEIEALIWAVEGSVHARIVEYESDQGLLEGLRAPNPAVHL